jgi:hypothetical protein
MGAGAADDGAKDDHMGAGTANDSPAPARGVKDDGE